MSKKNTPLRGFAKYSLNSDISDHSQSCRCVVTSEMLAQGVLLEPNPVGDFLFDHNADVLLLSVRTMVYCLVKKLLTI